MKPASARLPPLGRIVICLMLVSVGAAAALAHFVPVNAATTTTTTTNAFPVTINQPSFTGNATIIISGTEASSSQISVQIYNPRQVSMGIQTAAVRENSTFSVTYQASWPTWNLTGVYSVVVTAPIADYVGLVPTSYLSFDYTAVPTTTTSSSSSPITTISTITPGSGSSVTLQGLLPVLIAIVIVVGLVGFIFSSRGQRKPRAVTSPTTVPAPKPQRP